MIYHLSGSIENYKYLEIQYDGVNQNDNAYFYENTELIAVEQIKYNNSNTVSYYNESTISLYVGQSKKSRFIYSGIDCWFKDSQTLHIGLTVSSTGSWNKLRIRNIYGIQ